MKSFDFLIEDTLFKTVSLEKQKEFVIHSARRDYVVTWNEDSNPFDSINALAKNNNCIVIIDQKIYSLYRNKLSVDESRIYPVFATEEEKSLEGVERFLDFLVAKKASKANKIIVIGGGIVQEIGGFSAACYKRGMEWVLIPTTLLAMCDSCIGGKTSLNYKGVKNQLGFFEAPYKIIINPHFLKTLPMQDVKSGLGEILKLCILAGEDALDVYRSITESYFSSKEQSLISLLLTALSIKKVVIELDEFDQRERKALNYGHTIGHAIEFLTEYKIPHGLAVVVGMVLANCISVECGMLNVTSGKEINQLCTQLLDSNIKHMVSNINIKKLIELLASDKKAVGSSVQFILLQKLSVTKFVSIELSSEILMNALCSGIKENFNE